jgi:hypothetical protein
MMDPHMQSPMQWGTVGWDGDGGTFHELGQAGDDGNILVRVTLFRGRDQTKPIDQTRAQGQQILSKVSSTLVQIPPPGTRVLVALPEPGGMAAGGSMIVAADNPNPALIGNLKPGEAGLAGAEGKGRILFKKEMDAIVLYSEDGDNKGVVFYLGSDKIQIGNANGSLTIDATAITITAGQAAVILERATGKASLHGQIADVRGQIANLAGDTITAIGSSLGTPLPPSPGPLPAPASVLCGATGPVGFPSKNVVIMG